jgi:hypothetical protein
VAASGQFPSPNSGRFTRTDLTSQNGATDEAAVDAFFGAPPAAAKAPPPVRRSPIRLRR